jgi:DNA-binding winged helix-turn-helix (wHTH) protein
MAITVFEFADFKLDCDRFELCRAGHSLKLERKPMELLILLALRNGRLVTRTEIAERLWDSEIFVDTEHGINTAIRKIRVALHDTPEQPRFLQTVPGKGYRFIAPLVEAHPPSPEERSRPPSPQTGTPPSLPLPHPNPPTRNGDLPSQPTPRNSRPSVWLPALRAAAVPALLLVAISLGALGWGNRLLHRSPAR